MTLCLSKETLRILSFRESGNVGGASCNGGPGCVPHNKSKNCGSKNCGTKNCGSKMCGTNVCMSDACGTMICFSENICKNTDHCDSNNACETPTNACENQTQGCGATKIC